MTKWKKDAKEFTVSINYGYKRGNQAYIPKPILEKLSSPKKITFVISGKDIFVVVGD